MKWEKTNRIFFAVVDTGEYLFLNIVLSITPVLSIRVETGTLQNFPSNFKLFSRTKTKASTTRSARAVLQTTAAREPRRFLHNYFWEERGEEVLQ